MLRKTVVINADGSARCATLDHAAIPLVEVSIEPTHDTPVTTLKLYARRYNLSNANDNLFQHALPGLLGVPLLEHPVHFAWDHAATMHPSDLDCLLLTYVNQIIPTKTHNAGIGSRGYRLLPEEVPSDEEDDDDDLEDEEETDLSSEEEAEHDIQKFGSDEDECEEDEDTFCAE